MQIRSTRLRSLILLLLWALIPAEGLAEPSLGTATQAIVNGTRGPSLAQLTPGQLLAVGWLYFNGVSEQPMCTGTVIGPRTVITAAHCTRGQTPDTLGFGLGEQASAPVGLFEVEAIHEHPGVDAAVMVLVEDPLIRVPTLQAIPIARTPIAADALGTRLEGVGFGDTRDATRAGRYFVTVLLSAIQADYLFTDGEGIQGLCHGDSGGPLLSTEGAATILAVLHRGNSTCVDKDKLTRLDPITDWIDASAAGGEGGDCEGLDYFGGCEGRVAVWCEAGVVQRRDCALDDGDVCGYVDANLGFYCRPPSPCDAIPWGGICDNETLVMCDSAQVVYTDCAAEGLFCTDITPAASCQRGEELSRLQALNTRRVNLEGGCVGAPGAGAGSGPWSVTALWLLALLTLRRRRRRS